MIESPKMVQPVKNADSTRRHCRFDDKERLFSWSVRQDSYYLLFRVMSFHEVILESGEKLEVPEGIECHFSLTDIDPESAFDKVAEGNASDSSPMGPFFTWTGRELDAETGLQYNRARSYDPTVGRWLNEDPLGCDASEVNLYPYPSVANFANSSSLKNEKGIIAQ